MNESMAETSVKNHDLTVKKSLKVAQRSYFCLDAVRKKSMQWTVSHHDWMKEAEKYI